MHEERTGSGLTVNLSSGGIYNWARNIINCNVDLSWVDWESSSVYLNSCSSSWCSLGGINRGNNWGWIGRIVNNILQEKILGQSRTRDIDWTRHIVSNRSWEVNHIDSINFNFWDLASVESVWAWDKSDLLIGLIWGLI